MRFGRFNKIFSILLCLAVFLLLTGCCRKKNQAKAPVRETVKRVTVEEVAVEEKDESKASKLVTGAGLNYSISRAPAVMTPSNPDHIFEKHYLDGVKLLEKDDLAKALEVFQALLREFPEGEEASVAELCIAEIYFRNKNNQAALELYKEIVRKYPGTQAAQNAAEGIKYLESFSKYEENFISPEVEDQKRRGR